MQDPAPFQPAPGIDVLSLVADSVICTDEDGRILVFNPAAERSFGYCAREVIGQSVEMLLPESDRAAHTQHVRHFASRDGRLNRLMGHRREVRGLRKNGDVFPAEAMVSRQTLDGRTILTVVHRDITERRELEDLREAAAHELEHRLRNVLAVVNALVAISAASAVSLEEFRDSLTRRLTALAATQGVLSYGARRSIGLGELFLAELEQYRTPDGANVSVDGPPVSVGQKVAQVLALAIHELATNSAKYGALSRVGGHVAVTSGFEEDGGGGRFVIQWHEAGGPPVTPPERQGFGTRLIKQAVARALRADVTMDFRPDGLRCRLILPANTVETDGQQ